ncbi:MAG TPA: YkgJ family cysteine cluster protein [Gammaproteobacteria bacterium]
MACRAGCGACCIAPSISSAIPGMPDGKPAGVRCIQLDAQLRCLLWRDPRRPRVCSSFTPTPECCGEKREQAMRYLSQLEAATASSG